MKYKVNDRVRIKSLDWYNENKDEDDNVVCLYSYFDKGMSEFCDKIVTIKSLHGCPNVKAFRIIEDNGYSWWSDDMIEGLVEEETKPNIIEEAKTYWDSIKDAWICPEGYIFKDENGNIINTTKIVLEKKKNEYPKTYEECINKLDINEVVAACGWKKEIKALQTLLVCRDAYWKIAGEEMGLGKPWEPNWEDDDHESYPAIVACGGKIIKSSIYTHDNPFAFPTKEMRDAFYENFKEEIEQCKELL